MSHRPRKRFGQHFLHDAGVIRRIIRHVDPRPGDRIVEIGPGLGALTAPLLETTGRLEVVELDRDVIPHLEKRCAGLGELVVHQGDALGFDFAALAAAGQPLRLVGNLPYNISTPLIFHLLESATGIRDMTFMLQEEVVRRLGAEPGGKDYGRLSVMVQYRCRVRYLFRVPPGAFRPPPRVDSAVVSLVPFDEPPVAVGCERRFAEIVARAFGQRRKTLRRSLRERLAPPVFEAAGIDSGRRPETLTVAEFAALSRAAGETERDG